MGVTLAIFQSSGYTPIKSDWLKSIVKDGDKVSAVIFKMRQGIPSGPVAFLELIVLSIFITMSIVISENEKPNQLV